MQTQNTVGLTRMKLKRLELGLTQKKTAELSGVPAQLLSLIESGRFIPYPVHLSKIADALGIKDKDKSKLLYKV